MNTTDRTNVILQGSASLAELEKISLRFAQVLDSQCSLCDDLEALADSLPDSVDSQFCLRTAQRILPLVKSAHDFEETIMFPLLESQIQEMGQLAATLERLRYEHWGDQEFALDIHYALRDFVVLRKKANVDSLAWMLRGFFDGMRRHIAFDREYLLPMIKDVARKATRTAN